MGKVRLRRKTGTGSPSRNDITWWAAASHSGPYNTFKKMNERMHIPAQKYISQFRSMLQIDLDKFGDNYHNS